MYTSSPFTTKSVGPAPEISTSALETDRSARRDASMATCPVASMIVRSERDVSSNSLLSSKRNVAFATVPSAALGMASDASPEHTANAVATMIPATILMS
jgi:cytosine/adenosine deaminase-related metal-dependent hydrolase